MWSWSNFLGNKCFIHFELLGLFRANLHGNIFHLRTLHNFSWNTWKLKKKKQKKCCPITPNATKETLWKTYTSVFYSAMTWKIQIFTSGFQLYFFITFKFSKNEWLWLSTFWLAAIFYLKYFLRHYYELMLFPLNLDQPMLQENLKKPKNK